MGGLFDGRQIRCQIVSVPGQKELAHRRKLLIETADAVVLVLDTRQMEWEFGLGWVRDTVPFCRSKSPPVGLVLQANKRDAADAVSTEDMQRSLNRHRASRGRAFDGNLGRRAFARRSCSRSGSRSTAFARWLPQASCITGKPSEDDAAQLFERMQRRGALKQRPRSTERSLNRPWTRWRRSSRRSSTQRKLEPAIDGVPAMARASGYSCPIR